jgi:hypothetical protein
MPSQINPNNIDGAYPVTGQDNNSQGFRDNFTNIKVNFQDAAAEITDLQNKVLLKAPLTGSNVALTTSNDLAGTGPIIGALIRNFGANRVAVSATSGAIAINYSQGHYQSITTSGNISLSFTNFPATGTYGYLKLQINITNTAHTVTVPAAVTLGTAGLQGYNSGTNTISFGATGVYEFAFGTYDSGTTITIFDLNRALTNFTAADLQVDDVTATGNIVAGFGGVGYVSATGNVLSGQQVIASGNILGSNIVTGGTVSAIGNVIGGNINAVGAIVSVGNVNANFLNARVRPSVGTGAIAALQFTAGDVLSTPAAGAFEYDGISFYSTATANQRSVVPGTQFVMTPGLSPYTLTQSTSAQQIFGSPAGGGISLNASTTYMFEGLYIVSNTAAPSAAHSISLQFALGGSITSISYTADVTTSSGAPTAGATNITRTFSTSVGATQITPSGTTTNSELITVVVRGVVRTNAAGSFTPQIRYNTSAPGGTSIVQGNSYFKLIPIGTSSVISVGNWS